MRKMTTKIELRLSEFEKHRIKFLADKFSGGNISKWVKYCALNFPRENIENETETDTIKRPHRSEARDMKEVLAE